MADGLGKHILTMNLDKTVYMPFGKLVNEIVSSELKLNDNN